MIKPDQWRDIDGAEILEYSIVIVAISFINVLSEIGGCMARTNGKEYYEGCLYDTIRRQKHG